ncbi:MAG: RyR domain-containing protein [Eubacterium sp.]|nr:RyR domain-containing protein [Eubacterium sp.]
MFDPKPIDTSDIKLSDDVVRLTEMIAENVHNIWAKGRISEGWVYGEVRDDTRKTTPCLVPYDELPESEKDYDRNTAIETVKVIIKLGYRIEKNNCRTELNCPPKVRQRLIRKYMQSD